MPVPAFYAYLDDLARIAESQGTAAAAPGLARRLWGVPSDYPSGVDISNPVGIANACDRTDLNEFVLAAYQTGGGANAGRFGSVMAGKMAIDYQAAYERALHARFAPAVRSRVWAGARRAGHGDRNLGVFGAVEKAINKITNAANTIPNTPT